MPTSDDACRLADEAIRTEPAYAHSSWWPPGWSRPILLPVLLEVA